jgi:hypothetical protein
MRLAAAHRRVYPAPPADPGPCRDDRQRGQQRTDDVAGAGDGELGHELDDRDGRGQ